MRTIGFKDTYNIEIDGSDFNLHYTFEPGERETRMEPGCDPYVTIDKVMISAPDKDGNLVEVDVSSFIDVEIDYDWMCEQILESLKKD
tara:strand:- start:20 stop:283 length:264 start_codon:yes stop_codon:yes gene_type:complete